MQKLRVLITHYVPFFFGAPVFIWQLLFFLLPLLFMLIVSLTDQVDDHWFFTLTNFQSLFNTTYLCIIGRSLFLAFTNALFCLILSYPLAYFLAFKAKRLKYLFLTLLILPFWTNFLLHIYAWFFVLERGGFLNTVLMALGVINQPLHILNTMYAVYLMMIYYYLPFMALPLYATLERFDQRLIEASLDLGATWWQTFYKIMIPLSMPGILSGFLLVFVPSFAEFAIPELLGGDKKMFVGTAVSYQVLGGQTMHQGAAFTLFSASILMCVALILYWCVKKIVKMA